MPKQYTLFGRPVRVAPRRVALLFVALGLFAMFSLLFALPSTVPTGPSLSKSIADHKVSIPKMPKLKDFKDFKDTLSTSILNPYKPAVHPPEQKNSTYGGSSWYSHWNWLSPFSSSITLDENRSLLPELKKRTPIYCYYDTTIQREKATRDAESALLLTWRRAWWAQGFKPIILSAAEAMANPRYDTLQRMEVEPTFKVDMMRWLAWENMGGGLLSQYLVFPMDAYEKPLLTFLRRGEYPQLTRWQDFDDGLFAGPERDIKKAIAEALDNARTESTGGGKKKPNNVIEAVAKETFTIDKSHDALAFYSADTIKTKYSEVGEAIKANRDTGFAGLNLLINSHLHTTWLNLFPKGIAILQPLPAHTTHMVEPALGLAQWLATCGDTPLPSSCPPNLPKCTPCDATHPTKLTSPSRYHNTTGLYTIGTVPHPYTLAILNAMKADIDIPWIRRKMDRDMWLEELTKDQLGTSVGGNSRIVSFKEAVAGENSPARSVWLTAERDSLPKDLDWYFGFEIPVNGADDEGTAAGSQKALRPERNPADGPIAPEEEQKREPELIKRARELGKSKADKDVAVRNAIEAWNLADTEAWRFARAFLARSRVERLKWEEEESKYADGAGSEKDREGKKTSALGRWLD